MSMLWNTIIIEPMLNTLLFIYRLIGGNFGLAIILFTLLIRLITHPLTVQQMRGTQKMQELQNSDEWKAIQKKYKDDKEKLAKAQMELYQKVGFNPFAPCLPTLIQFPIIIGLYQAIIRALSSSPIQLIELSKHVYPFINASQLIPLASKFLWMDLGEPERLVILGLGIPVLTILVVVTTYLQSKLMATPSVGPADQGAQMNKMMNLYMPLLMGYIAYTLPSGLAIYFVAGNVFSITQYAALGKLNWKNILPKRKETK